MNIILLEVKKLKTKRNLFFPSLWGMVEHQKKVTMNPTATNPFFGPPKIVRPLKNELFYLWSDLYDIRLNLFVSMKQKTPTAAAATTTSTTFRSHT